MNTLQGTPASPGIGIGTAHIVRAAALHAERRPVTDPAAERARFVAALDAFCQGIERAAAALGERVGAEESAILLAQTVIARDPELLAGVEARLTAGENAEYAVGEVCDGFVALFAAMDDELLQARAADFRDIRDGLLRSLTGEGAADDLSRLPLGTVLVAGDVTPSQAAGLSAQTVAAIVTEQGTPFAHIAILARALQIPAVVGLPGATAAVQDGDTLIVDGATGTVHSHPDRHTLHEAEAQRQQQAERRQRLEAYRTRETRTADGKRIQLAANLAVQAELADIRAAHADGIGLFRTEFLYMDAASAPGEEEQFAAYKTVALALQGKPVVVRTLDVGGDKEIPYLGIDREENPFLGHRAVRYCLDNPRLFRTQLRAMLRASAFGDLHILVPMVTGIDELRAVRKLLEHAKAELREERVAFNETIPLGVMIETPAAALLADTLAKECDFFSLGTNDLTQYTLAVDRGNPRVAPLYSPHHPAVLQLLHITIESANRVGIPVGICGEAGADPLLVPFLVGCGIDELSVGAPDLLAVREQVCNLSACDWRKRVPALLSLATAKEVEIYIRQHL